MLYMLTIVSIGISIAMSTICSRYISTFFHVHTYCEECIYDARAYTLEEDLRFLLATQY
jgi:hypothetical protein